MSLVTHNINMILLVTIIVLAIFGVGYYHYQELRYQDVYQENIQLESTLGSLEQNLTIQEERLRRTFEELQAKLQDSLQFEGLYTNLTGQNEDLAESLERVQRNYQTERELRQRAEDERNDFAQQLAERTAQYNLLQTQLSICQDQRATCQNSLLLCQGS